MKKKLNFRRNGLDTLKKQLGDFYSDSGQARAFVQAIKSKVDTILNTQVKGYKDMTSGYAKASHLLEDIKSATGVGGKANADTVFTKLTSAMRGDKEFRLEVLKEMENAGEPMLMDKIAGANMQSFVPKGLVGRGIDVITAYQLLQGAFSAKFLPMLLATSPRVVGEFVRALGIGASKTKSIIDAVNRLPENFDMTPIQFEGSSEAGFAKFPFMGKDTPKGVSPATVAKNIAGKDITLIQDFVNNPDSLTAYLRLQPVIESAGLDKLDAPMLKKFFDEVIHERNSSEGGLIEGSSKPVTKKYISGPVEGNFKK